MACFVGPRARSLPCAAALVLAGFGALPAAAQDADEVIVITESRRERPLSDATVATEVIPRAAIEASGAENLAEVLQGHPGVEVVRSFRGSALRVQGLDPDHVLILVDGERTVGRIGGAIDLERFPVEDIERIEIVKGASSALYGSDALAGVVNIITRRGRRAREAEVHSSYGSFGTTDVSGRIAVREGAWNTHATAGWHRSDGYDRAPDTVATTASAYDEVHVTNRTDYRASGELALRAGAEYLVRDQHGIDQNAAGAVFDRSTRTETASASMGGRWRPHKRAQLALSAHYALWRDQYLLDQRNADALDVYEVAREQLGQVTVQYDRVLTSRHFATLGAEGLIERLQADRLASDGVRTRVSAFGQHEWIASTTPHVVVVPGMRVDVDSQFGAHVTPKLAGRWDLSPGWIARASYGWGFRAPSFRELLLRFENPSAGYRVQGNPALEPETSASVNAGLEVRLGRAWWSAGVFHNDIDNLITVDALDAADGQVFGYVNVASARTRGAESSVALAVVPNLRVELAYALTDTLDRATGAALPGRALHRGSLELAVRVPAARIDGHVRAHVVGRRAFADGDDTLHAEPYAALAARVQTQLTSRLVVFGGVDNVLDAGDPTLLPIAPRSFYGGVTARY